MKKLFLYLWIFCLIIYPNFAPILIILGCYSLFAKRDMEKSMTRITQILHEIAEENQKKLEKTILPETDGYAELLEQDLANTFSIYGGRCMRA